MESEVLRDGKCTAKQRARKKKKKKKNRATKITRAKFSIRSLQCGLSSKREIGCAQLFLYTDKKKKKEKKSKRRFCMNENFKSSRAPNQTR